MQRLKFTNQVQDKTIKHCMYGDFLTHVIKPDFLNRLNNTTN